MELLGCCLLKGSIVLNGSISGLCLTKAKETDFGSKLFLCLRVSSFTNVIFRRILCYLFRCVLCVDEHDKFSSLKKENAHPHVFQISRYYFVLYCFHSNAIKNVC